MVRNSIYGGFSKPPNGSPGNQGLGGGGSPRGDFSVLMFPAVGEGEGEGQGRRRIIKRLGEF